MDRKPLLHRTGWLRAGLAVALLLALPPGGPTRGEELPTKGTFRGIYRVSLAGVGRLRFFIFHRKLLEQMAPYQGKYVEVEVTEASQPMNPGPAVVTGVGKVTVLPPAPLAIDIRPVAPGTGGAKTLDIVYAFRNAAEEPVVLNASNITIGVLGPVPADRKHEPDRFFGTGYTRQQLAFPGRGRQPWNFITPMHPGQSTHFYTSKVRLLPGEAAPFVWHSVELRPGKYEIVVGASHRAGRDKPVPIRASAPLDVPLRKPTRRAPPRLVARGEGTLKDEWLDVTGELRTPDDKPVYLFVKGQGEGPYLPGLLQFYDAEGERVAAWAEWRGPDGPWVRRALHEEPVAFRFRVRQQDLFSHAAIARIGLWTVTDAGLEKVTLAKDLPAPAAWKMPPWGKTVKGCRCRIRLPKRRFASGETIRLFLQATSDKSKADILWMNEGTMESRFRVEVDGLPAPIGSNQWPDGHVIELPHQGEVTLSWQYKPSPGKHRVRVSITSDGGVYTNLKGKPYRKLDGTLVSNEVEFEVAE